MNDLMNYLVEGFFVTNSRPWTERLVVFRVQQCGARTQLNTVLDNKRTKKVQMALGEV